MNKIISLISADTLNKDFAQDIRERNLDQRFLYIVGDGAKKYYRAYIPHVSDPEQAINVISTFLPLI